MLTNPTSEDPTREQFGLASGRDYTDTSQYQTPEREQFAPASGKDFEYEDRTQYGMSPWFNSNKVGQVNDFLDMTFDDKPEVGQALEQLIIEYPTISRELAAGLAMSGQLTADSALLSELIEIDARAQASASSIPIYTAAKRAVRGSFIVMEDLYNNAPFMSIPRTMLNMGQNATRQETHDRAFASNAANARRLDQLGFGRDYGEGFIPSRDLVPQSEGFWDQVKEMILAGTFEGSAEEDIARANQQASVQYAIQNGLNPNFFTTNMWEQTKVHRSINGVEFAAPFSPGAGVAINFSTPGTRSYNLFSGSIDAAFRMYGEPADFALDTAGDLIVAGFNPKVVKNSFGFGVTDVGSDTMKSVLNNYLDMDIVEDPLIRHAQEFDDLGNPIDIRNEKGVTSHTVDAEGTATRIAIDPEAIQRGWAMRIKDMGTGNGESWKNPDDIYAAFFIEKKMTPNDVLRQLQLKGGDKADMFLTIEHENIHNTVHNQLFEIIETTDEAGELTRRIDKERPKAGAPDEVIAISQRYVDENATMAQMDELGEDLAHTEQRATLAAQEVDELSRYGVDLTEADEIAEHTHKLDEAMRKQESLESTLYDLRKEVANKTDTRQSIDNAMRRYVENDAVAQAWNNMSDGSWKAPEILKRFKRDQGLSSIIRPFAQPKSFHEWINGRMGKATIRTLAQLNDIEKIRKAAPDLELKDVLRIANTSDEALVAHIYKQAFDGGTMGIARPTIGTIRSTRIRSMDGWVASERFLGGSIGKAMQRQGRRMTAGTGNEVLDITDLPGTLDTINAQLATYKVDAVHINELQQFAIKHGKTQTGIKHIESEIRRLSTERMLEIGGGKYDIEDIDQMWDEWSQWQMDNKIYWLSRGGKSRDWIWHNSKYKNLDELEKAGIEPEAHLEAQFAATSIVLPDIRRTRRLSSKQRSSLEWMRQRTSFYREPGAEWTPLGFQSSLALRVGDAGFGVWRDMQLLRGGWAVRILSEEQIRFGASGFAGLLSNPLDYLISVFNDLDFIVDGDTMKLGDYLKAEEALGAGGLRDPGMPLHRVKGSDWKAARRKKKAETKHFWGGIRREFISQSRDEVTVLVARMGKEKALEHLISTDEGRAILTRIATDAAQETSLGKVRNIDDARKWLDTVELRTAELTGGGGLWKTTTPGPNFGQWVDEWDRVTKPVSEMTMAEMIDELEGGITGRTNRRKPQLEAELNQQRGFNLDELNEADAAAVVTRDGNSDLIDFIANRKLDDLDISDDLTYRQSRDLEKGIEDAYGTRGVEPPESIPVAADEMGRGLGRSTYNKATDRIFQLLNGIPSQVLNRQPYFQQSMGHKLAVAYFYGDSEFRSALDELRRSNHSFNVMMELGDSKILKDMGLKAYPKPFDPIKPPKELLPPSDVTVIPNQPTPPTIVDDFGNPIRANQPEYVDVPFEAYKAEMARNPIEPTPGMEVLDEETGAMALQLASEVMDPDSFVGSKRVGMGFDKTERVTTSSGREIEIKYGVFGRNGQPGAIALDLDGNIIGARIDGFAGVEAGARREGVYSAMIEGQVKHQSLRPADFALENIDGDLSGAAAGALNKTFDNMAPETWQGVPGPLIRTFKDAEVRLGIANVAVRRAKDAQAEAFAKLAEAAPSPKSQGTRSTLWDELSVELEKVEAEVVRQEKNWKEIYDARNTAREEVRVAADKAATTPDTPVGVKPLQPSDVIDDVEPPMSVYENEAPTISDDPDIIPGQAYHDSVSDGYYDRIPLQDDPEQFVSEALFQALDDIGASEAEAMKPRGIYTQRNARMDRSYTGFPGLSFSASGGHKGRIAPEHFLMQNRTAFEKLYPEKFAAVYAAGHTSNTKSPVIKIMQGMESDEILRIAKEIGWDKEAFRTGGVGLLPGRATGVGDAPAKYGDMVDVFRNDHYAPDIERHLNTEGDLEQVFVLNERFPELYARGDFAEKYNAVRNRTRFKATYESYKELADLYWPLNPNVGLVIDILGEARRIADDVATRGLADTVAYATQANEIGLYIKSIANGETMGIPNPQAFMDGIKSMDTKELRIFGTGLHRHPTLRTGMDQWTEAELNGIGLELGRFVTADPMLLTTPKLRSNSIEELVLNEADMLDPARLATNTQRKELKTILKRRSYQPEETLLQQEPIFPVARLHYKIVDKMTEGGMMATSNRQVGDIALTIDRNLERGQGISNELGVDRLTDLADRSVRMFSNENRPDRFARRVAETAEMPDEQARIPGQPNLEPGDSNPSWNKDSSPFPTPAARYPRSKLDEGPFNPEKHMITEGMDAEQVIDYERARTNFETEMWDNEAFNDNSEFMYGTDEGPVESHDFTTYATNPDFRAYVYGANLEALRAGIVAETRLKKLVDSIAFIDRDVSLLGNPIVEELIDELVSVSAMSDLAKQGRHYAGFLNEWYGDGALPFKDAVYKQLDGAGTFESSKSLAQAQTERLNDMFASATAEITNSRKLYQMAGEAYGDKRIFGAATEEVIDGYNLSQYKPKDHVKGPEDLQLDHSAFTQAERNESVQKIFPGADAGQNYDYMETGGFGAFKEATPTGIDRLETVMKAAKNDAIEDTKFLFYDLAGKSNAADAARFIFPFGDAFIEVLSRWAAIMNPTRSGGQAFRNVRRATVTAQAAQQSGFIETNEYGEEVFNWPLAPGMLANMFIPSASTMQLQASMPVASLTFIDPTARGVMMPGIGPGVQMAVQALAPVTENIPLLHDALQWVTYGAQDEYRPGDLNRTGDVLTSFMPTVMRRLGAAVFQQEALEALGATKMRLFESFLISGDAQFDPADPDGARKAWDVANTTGTWLGWLRVLDSWFLPGQPQYQPKSQTNPGQLDYQTTLYETAKLPYNEQKPIISLLRMQAEFRHARNLFGDHEAEMYMVERYGILPTILQAASSGQVDRPVTWGGINWVDENEWLTEFAPYTLAGTVPPDADDTFSTSAWNNLFSDQLEVDGVTGQPIRSSKTALEIQQAIERGFGYDQLSYQQEVHDAKVDTLRRYYGKNYASNDLYRAQKKTLDATLVSNKEAIYSEFQIVRGSNQGTVVGSTQGVTNRRMMDELIDIGTQGSQANKAFRENVPELADVAEKYSFWFSELERVSLAKSSTSTGEWWMSSTSSEGDAVREWLTKEIEKLYGSLSDPHAKAYAQWINTRLMDQLIDDWEWVDRAFSPEMKSYSTLEFTNDNLGFQGALTDG